MFARVYSRHLKHGDLKALAHDTRKSVEWLSRMTRVGGDDDPGAKYVRWFDTLFEQNEDCARALEAEVQARLDEIKSKARQGKWCPQETAQALLHQASESIGALINKVTTDDEAGLVRLLVKVQEALEHCRASSEAAPMRIEKR